MAIITHKGIFSKIDRSSWLLILYFILRIPIALFINTQDQLIKITWLSHIVEFLFYIIILTLIYVERAKLEKSNITSISLFIIWGSALVLGIIEVNSWLNLIFYISSLLLTIISIITTKQFLNHNGNNNLKEIVWIFCGIMIGIIFSILMNVPDWKEINSEIVSKSNFSRSVIFSYIIWFLNHLNHAAILEEPIYRGFIWGVLRERGWKEINILIFSAILFWISHLDSIILPFTFFIALPLISLILGIITIKSKSISPAMALHASYNSVMAIFMGITTR